MGWLDKLRRKAKLPSELNSLSDLQGSALEIMAALNTARKLVNDPGNLELQRKLAAQLKALGL